MISSSASLLKHFMSLSWQDAMAPDTVEFYDIYSPKPCNVLSHDFVPNLRDADGQVAQSQGKIHRNTTMVSPQRRIEIMKLTLRNGDIGSRWCGSDPSGLIIRISSLVFKSWFGRPFMEISPSPSCPSGRYSPIFLPEKYMPRNLCKLELNTDFVVFNI